MCFDVKMRADHKGASSLTCSFASRLQNFGVKAFCNRSAEAATPDGGQ